MKMKHIAMVMASALLTVGLIPMGSAQSDPGSAQDGIEVITVVGKRPVPEGIDVITVAAPRPVPEGIEVITVAATHAAPEGIEVITVVGKRPEPTLARTCVNEVVASRVPGDRASVRQAIRNCIEQAQS